MQRYVPLVRWQIGVLNIPIGHTGCRILMISITGVCIAKSGLWCWFSLFSWLKQSLAMSCALLSSLLNPTSLKCLFLSKTRYKQQPSLNLFLVGHMSQKVLFPGRSEQTLVKNSIRDLRGIYIHVSGWDCHILRLVSHGFHIFYWRSLWNHVTTRLYIYDSVLL